MKEGTQGSQCTTQHADKCYRSAFVTDGALLGIISIGSNAEHIIALDANAVDDRANDGARVDGLVQTTRRRKAGFLRAALCRHRRILA